MSSSLRLPLLFLTALLLFAMGLWGSGCSESTPEDQDGLDAGPPGLASVTPVDASHLEVVFDEDVDETTAEYNNYYGVYRTVIPSPESTNAAKAPGAWGDTLEVRTAALMLDGKTVLLQLNPWMENGVAYYLVVHSVKDLVGNVMTGSDTLNFTGVSTPDQTPPEITDRSPAPGATGVGIGQSVQVTFSEQMLENSVENAFTWTGPGGDVSFHMDWWAENLFVFTPLSPLSYGTQYTVEFAANTAMDFSNNHLAPSTWSFTTTNIPDNTPPTVVSTHPADGAVNVPLDVVLQITFSEPIDPTSMLEGGVIMTPQTSDGLMTWTNGGKTLNYAPDSLLLAGTAYSLLVIEGSFSDFAGNPLASSYPVSFSTGPALPPGSFSGTIAGDSRSPGASNPQGALVAALMENLIVGGDDQPPIAGSAIVGSNGSYVIQHLEDGTYWPVSVMDSNNDGLINPEEGDAMGVYGVDFSTLQGEPQPDSVIISGGNHVSSIDFALFDPVTIMGDVSYMGSIYSSTLWMYQFYVGVFNAATFDTTGGFPQPDMGTDGGNLDYDPSYRIHQFDGLDDGTYYVGAFLDINYNMSFDSNEPGGMYEVGGEWDTVTVENGYDAFDIDINLYDPGQGPVPHFSSGSSWANLRAPLSSR